MFQSQVLCQHSNTLDSYIPPEFKEHYKGNFYVNKFVNPAAERNKEPILRVLQSVIDKNKYGDVLEISSGTGQHCAYFAPNFPNLIFQPSEYDKDMLPQIKLYMDDCATKNIRDPLLIDITSPSEAWGLHTNKFQFMININMMHISPFKCTECLFENAGKILDDNGILFTYGPYAQHGVLEPQSNIDFDKSLRSRNSQWGIRDIDDLEKIAKRNGITLKSINNMPANNKCIIWEKNKHI